MTHDQSRISEIIELAWADEVSFNAIEDQFGLSEGEVIKLMRKKLKPSSFRLWRTRVSGRIAKHAMLHQSRQATDVD